MSREVRRVPIDWKHPVEPNPYWRDQNAHALASGRPLSQLHMPQVRFVGLMDGYTEAVERWEQEGRDLAERTGFDWTFSVKWHLTGYDECSCHPGETNVRHPGYRWSADGQEETPFVLENEDQLHAWLTAKHATERPESDDYMPVFTGNLGWCLYETVSEGCPVTPVFASAKELIDHLSTVGQDWDQVPMRRAAAEALVSRGGSFGSFLAVGGQLFKSDVDADLIAALPKAVAP